MMRTILLVALAAGVLAAAGCGSEEPSPDASTTTVETPPTTVESPAPTTVETPPKPRTIVIVVDQGRPRGGIKRPTLEKGEKVVIVVRADAGEGLHIHGYDIEKPVTPGKAVRVPLTATIPGRFEVELHHPDSLLAVLEVRP
jgi:ABC-type Fe3+-hydroxamate transport system substrate-binding protein